MKIPKTIGSLVVSAVLLKSVSPLANACKIQSKNEKVTQPRYENVNGVKINRNPNLPMNPEAQQRVDGTKVVKTSGSKRTTIKTKLSKLNTLKRFVDEDILINKITLSYAQQVFDEIDSKGYVYQVNKEALSIFKNVFEYTRRIYKLQDLEFLKDITLNKRIKSYDEVKTKRNKYLELNEIESIIKDINMKAQKMHSGIHKQFYSFVALMTEFPALNGMRIGEMLAIQNGDIDFDNKSLNINGTIHWFHDESGGFGVKDTTKTESSYRTIGLSSRSCEILKKAILENKKDSKWNDGYLNRNFVFTNHKGNPMQTERFNKILRESAKDVGIDKEISSHILRHSHISLLSQQGVSLKAIMDRVGHADHRTTLSIFRTLQNRWIRI